MEEEEKMGCTHSCEGCHACGHDHEDEDEGILTFVDEEGNDVRFEILDVVSMDDKEYLVVLPLDEQEEDEGNVLILEIKQEDGEEVYDTVVNDEEAEKVFAKFQEQNEISEEDEE